MGAPRVVILVSILMAAAGIAAAADSTRALMKCHENLLAVKYVPMNCDHVPPDRADELAFCENQKAAVDKAVEVARADAAHCDPGLIYAAVIYDRLRTLAVNGDLTAQRCFIAGHFGTSDTSMEFAESRIRKDQREDYPPLARGFIDDAFERGDWRVVRYLSRDRFYIVDGMLSSAYPFGSLHPETTYRMEYLLMLGKHPDDRGDDAHRLIELWKKNMRLPAARRAEAEAWAQRMYQRHFKDTADSDVDMCDAR